MISGQDGSINETFNGKPEEVVPSIVNNGSETLERLKELLKELYDTDPEVRELVDKLAGIEPKGKHRKIWYQVAKDEIELFVSKVIAKGMTKGIVEIVELISRYYEDK
jgi:hypothetical protein